MSAILVLLALLSVSTLATRKGAAAFLVSILTTPLLLALGFLLSRRGLALVPDTTADTLLPAIRVGTAWLALLVGMRAARPEVSAAFLKRSGAAAAFCTWTWLGLGALAYGLVWALTYFDYPVPGVDSWWSAIGLALLLGGVMTGSGYKHEATDEAPPTGVAETFVAFVSRHDEMAGALALLGAIVLLPLAPETAPIYTDTKETVFVVVGLGLSLAFAQVLAGQSDKGDLASSRIAIIGLLVFASGLSTSALLPDAAIAFFFGAALATTPRASLLLSRGLWATENPVRLAVLALVGMHLGFTAPAVAAGVALAFGRLALKLVQARLVRADESSHSLYSFLSSSGLSIPFAVSFAFTQPRGLTASFVLTTVCVAVSVSDLITFFASRRRIGDDTEAAKPESDDAAADDASPAQAPGAAKQGVPA